MDFLGKLFTRVKRGTERQDPVELARHVGQKVNDATMEIFAAYREELVQQPNTFIVPAVWGDSNQHSLSPVQKEIHDKVISIIDDILNSLGVAELGHEKEYAIGFLVRDLFITKVVFMVELFKNQMSSRFQDTAPDPNPLEKMEIQGNA